MPARRTCAGELQNSLICIEALCHRRHGAVEVTVSMGKVKDEKLGKFGP